MNSSGLTFDHLIHLTDDLEATMAGYDSCGLQTHHALTMPGFRNAAWSTAGERYVELATIDDWDAIATSKYAESLRILRPAIEAISGAGPATFAVDVPDAAATAERLRQSGRQVEQVDIWFEDRGGGFTEVFLLDQPSYFPFFITYNPPRAETSKIRAEARVAGRLPPVSQVALIALLARSPEPEADAGRLGDLLGCEVSDSTVALSGADVRFVVGVPAGLYGISVRGPGVTPGEAAGMTIELSR